MKAQGRYVRLCATDQLRGLEKLCRKIALANDDDGYHQADLQFQCVLQIARLRGGGQDLSGNLRVEGLCCERTTRGGALRDLVLGAKHLSGLESILLDPRVHDEPFMLGGDG
jgi:hypothetical protein